jgi:hypothetical protein
MRLINLSAVVAVCALLIGTATQSKAGQGRDDYYPGGDGRLVIRYSPSLGLNAALRVFINGRGAGGITKGHTYVAHLPPGRHEIRVSRNGRLYESSDRIVSVRPGETYAFLAKYNVNEMILVPAYGLRPVMSPQF